jgi:hypothetical protein
LIVSRRRLACIRITVEEDKNAGKTPVLRQEDVS